MKISKIACASLIAFCALNVAMASEPGSGAGVGGAGAEGAVHQPNGGAQGANQGGKAPAEITVEEWIKKANQNLKLYDFYKNFKTDELKDFKNTIGTEVTNLSTESLKTTHAGLKAQLLNLFKHLNDNGANEFGDTVGFEDDVEYAEVGADYIDEDKIDKSEFSTVNSNKNVLLFKDGDQENAKNVRIEHNKSKITISKEDTSIFEIKLNEQNELEISGHLYNSENQNQPTKINLSTTTLENIFKFAQKQYDPDDPSFFAFLFLKNVADNKIDRNKQEVAEVLNKFKEIKVIDTFKESLKNYDPSSNLNTAKELLKLLNKAKEAAKSKSTASVSQPSETTGSAQNEALDKALAAVNKFIVDNKIKFSNGIEHKTMKAVVSENNQAGGETEPASAPAASASPKAEESVVEADDKPLYIDGVLSKITAENLDAAIKYLNKTTTAGGKLYAETQNEIKLLEALKTKYALYRTKIDELLGVASKQLTPDELAKNETLIINDANKEISKLSGDLASSDATVKTKAIQKRAELLQGKSDAIAANPANKLSTDQAQVLQAFGGTAKNEAFVKILTGSKEEIIAAVKEAVSSIEQSTKALNSSVSGEALKFSSGSAVNTRLAKLSNPYNADLALAYAISNLKDDALADGGNSINSVVKAYTDRFNFDHSVWANAIAANAKVDGVKPKMLGASFGYDSVFDNTILGGYLSIAKSKLSTKLVSQKGTNTQLGIYARSFVDNHEIDVKASFGFGKTKLDRSQNGSRQNSKFSSKSFSLEGEYGYLAQLIDGVILKPFVGLNYNYARTPSFKESGAMALEFGKTKHSGLNAKLGAELRLYTDGGSYAFIQPSLEREIAKSKDKISLRYVGSNRDIVLDGKAKKATYFGVQAGAEFGLTDNLSLNLGVGYKGKSKEQYYNASAGLRYKF